MQKYFLLIALASSLSQLNAMAPLDPHEKPALWASAEYLLWWVNNSPLCTPLVTISNTSDFGVIGAPSTRVVIGEEEFGFGQRNGGRFGLAGWFGEDCCWGWDANFFFLGAKTDCRHASVDGFEPLVIAFPFIDDTPGGLFGNPGQENGYVFGAPVGIVGHGFAGIADVSIRNTFLGTELNGLYTACESESARIDGIFGFRYLRLNENLIFNTSSPTVELAPDQAKQALERPLPDEAFLTTDQFDCQNNFYGGQFGARILWRAFDCFNVNAIGKVALGATRQKVSRCGELATNDYNTPFGTGPIQVFDGGYIALPETNSGECTHTRFAVALEAGLNIGYEIYECLDLIVGGTVIFLQNVLRPGNQIDRHINGTQSALYEFSATPQGLMGLAVPEPIIRPSDFWATGFNFGIGYSF